jgi:diadenosine tetraphosphate (Ap4A) HIT family hydrolase
VHLSSFALATVSDLHSRVVRLKATNARSFSILGSMDKQAKNCPFCRKNGLLNSEIIQSTEQAYLIENTYHPGNFLIIPELHATDIQQLPDTWWSDVKKLLKAVPRLSSDYNISLNVGVLAGQTQAHLHFWVIPRTADSAGTGKGLLGLMQLLKDGQE